jgi:hypothetical protein
MLNDHRAKYGGACLETSAKIRAAASLRDQVVMRRMEGGADRGAAVGDIPVAGEMEDIRRLIGRVRFTTFRGRPVP